METKGDMKRKTRQTSTIPLIIIQDLKIQEEPHLFTKTPMLIKLLLLGGGVGVSWKGGWKCQFYSYGRGDFPEIFDSVNI